MRSFLAALSMLSIFPTGNFLPTEKDLKSMISYYPLVGLLFGGLFYALGLGAAQLPSPVGAMLLALLPEVFTKGFHLDGLADTADGFLSGRSRERKLEIMRDSHIGTMGVGAIFALLGLKFSLYAALPAAALPTAAAMSALCGRCELVWHIGTSRYARKDGLGKWSFGAPPWPGMLLGIMLPAAAGVALLRLPGLWFPAVTVIFGLLWSRLTEMVIGGATGDTLGATEELAELLTLGAALWIFA